MEREMPDHTPLLLDIGDHKKIQPIFRFENAWMLMEGFREFVEKNWNIKYRGSSLDIWQSKCRNIRQKIKGWLINANVVYRKRKKKELLGLLDELDKNAEIRGLSAQDIEIRKALIRELKDILKMEEIKWLQRYKDRQIREGDSNTRYYHAKVNGRRRKK